MQYMRTGETEGGAYDKRGFTYLASLGYSDSGECIVRPMGPSACFRTAGSETYCLPTRQVTLECSAV